MRKTFLFAAVALMLAAAAPLDTGNAYRADFAGMDTGYRADLAAMETGYRADFAGLDNAYRADIG